MGLSSPVTVQFKIRVLSVSVTVFVSVVTVADATPRINARRKVLLIAIPSAACADITLYALLKHYLEYPPEAIEYTWLTPGRMIDPVSNWPVALCIYILNSANNNSLFP